MMGVKVLVTLMAIRSRACLAFNWGKNGLQELGQKSISRGWDAIEFLSARTLSSQSNHAIRTIRKIMMSVGDHGVINVFSEFPPHVVLASIYALSRLQDHVRTYEMQLQHDETSGSIIDNTIDSTMLNDLHYFSVYAQAAYGWKMDLAFERRLRLGDLHSVLHRLGVDRSDIVFFNSKADTHRPAFFIVRDWDRHALVLCVRGTLSAHDVLTDMCCNAHEIDTKASRIRAHHGMLEAASAIALMATQIVERELRKYPELSLVVVGHSMGGGVAALLSTIWSEKFPQMIAYTYGPPCVAPLGAAPTQSQSIVSVVIEGDPFSCLSLGHVADLSIALSHLCSDLELRRMILIRTDESTKDRHERDLRWCLHTLKRLRKDMTEEKLYPPGKIVLLSTPPTQHMHQRSDAPYWKLSRVSTESFRELTVRPKMFDLSKHFVTVYEGALRQLIDGEDDQSR